MLGIRHIQGVALDFWVGAPPFFSCDRSFVFKGDLKKFEDFKPQTVIPDSQLMNTEEVESLSQIPFGQGHLAFSPLSGVPINELFDFIESSIIGVHTGRVTIIFPDVETHDHYFAEVARRFPEND